MNHIIVEATGYAAAVVGTALMLPQVLKTWKTKKVDDLSMFMVILYLMNCALWLAYGSLLQSMPMILCNSIALGISIIQLIFKIKYTSRIRNL